MEQNASPVLEFIEAMTIELEMMARRHDLSTLALLFAMATLEASQIRQSVSESCPIAHAVQTPPGIN